MSVELPRIAPHRAATVGITSLRILHRLVLCNIALSLVSLTMLVMRAR
jgi:hypothetical protein